MNKEYDFPSIAIITFTDAREEGISNDAVENHLRKKQGELRTLLEENNISVIDPLENFRSADSSVYGIRSIKEVDAVCRVLQTCSRVDAVIIGAWTWSPPMFIREFIRKFPKPLLYYTENDPFSGSLSQMTASSAGLLEWGVNKFAAKHERNFGNKDDLLKWVRGVSAVSRMGESALLLWGGSYAVKMDHLQDDYTLLKNKFIREVLFEDQYILIQKAEKIRMEEKERINSFISWIKEKGLTVIPDEKMVTEKALSKQSALLLAARDRLEELSDENICGVSIKCQHEIYSGYGVNACTLPAFLPFPENENGKQQIYPTVCEGDTKGLLTAVLLHMIKPGVPPAFGDIVSVEDDCIEFANCGAGSLFWAANSGNSEESFPRVQARANIHGNSGAAFHYYGVPAGKITLARLTRINGNYYMQIGVGEELDSRKILNERLGKNEPAHLAGTWGVVTINLNTDKDLFVKTFGANHLSVTLGDVSKEIEAACLLWDVPVIRMDSKESMKHFYTSVRMRGKYNG